MKREGERKGGKREIERERERERERNRDSIIILLYKSCMIHSLVWIVQMQLPVHWAEMEYQWCTEPHQMPAYHQIHKHNTFKVSYLVITEPTCTTYQ